MPIKIKDGKKLCRTCNERKPREDHHPAMQQTCITCMDGRTPDEFKEFIRVRNNRQREVYRKAHKKTLLKKLGDAKEKRGYIYLLHSESKNIYKIGVSLDPYQRCKALSGAEYGISDLRLLAFSIPIGDAYHVEGWLHNKMRMYNFHYKKPCGNYARELFECSFDIISKLFISCSQAIQWKDEPTFCSVDISKIPKILMFERGRKKSEEYKIRKKMHRSFHNYRKSIASDWRLFDAIYLRKLKCYATGDRQDHLFESIFDKANKNISLGVFKDPGKAIGASREFGDFIKSEKKIKRKYIRKTIYDCPPLLKTTSFWVRMSEELELL